MSVEAIQIDALWSGINNPTNGKSYSGAIVATFASGTSTPKAVWEDKEKTLPSSIGKSQFVLDSNGQAFVFGDGKYKINIYAPTDTGLTSPLITIDGAEYVTSSQILSLSNNYNNDLAAAVAAIGSDVVTLTISEKPNDLTGNLTQPENIVFDWKNGAPLGGAFTLTLNGGLIASKYRIFEDELIIAGNPKTDVIHPAWSGDDLTKSFSIGTGKTIELEKSKTYTENLALTLPENSTLKMNGAVIDFVVSGAVQNLILSSGTNISGGTVENTGSSPSGAGQFQCPIVIGDFAIGTGISNVAVHDMKIESNRPDGNGIFVTGDSHNITIDNINFPSSATLGRPILVHWGGADSPSSGTFHPHNVNISNIKLGDMSESELTSAGVFLSGAYDISVDNISAGTISYQSGLLSVYAGDWGTLYADSDIAPLIGSGITASNGSCIAATSGAVCKIDNKGVSDTGNAILPGPTIINFRGEGVGVGAGKNGFLVSNTIGGSLSNSAAAGFISGVNISAAVKNFRIENGQYSLNLEEGVKIANSTTPPEGITVDGIRAAANGVGGGNHAGILIGESVNTSVRNNVLGDIGESTQAWGVRAVNEVLLSKVEDNHVLGATSSAYSMGASTTYAVSKTFFGNTAESGITVQSGMNPQISNTYNRGSVTIIEGLGDGAPTVGDWIRGSRIWDETPSAGGTEGWICVTSGTPGTWKTFGAIAP